jgi:hypothetical protein
VYFLFVAKSRLTCLMNLSEMFIFFQFDEDDVEEDIPLEKRKKLFCKECEYLRIHQMSKI